MGVGLKDYAHIKFHFRTQKANRSNPARSRTTRSARKCSRLFSTRTFTRRFCREVIARYRTRRYRGRFSSLCIGMSLDFTCPVRYWVLLWILTVVLPNGDVSMLPHWFLTSLTQSFQTGAQPHSKIYNSWGYTVHTVFFPLDCVWHLQGDYKVSFVFQIITCSWCSVW